MATIFQFFKFEFLRLVITFFVFLAPTIVMLPGDCCFNVYYVNVNFHTKSYVNVNFHTKSSFKLLVTKTQVV